MWTAFRVFFSGALKRVLAELIPWLKTEAAKFVSEYMVRAVPIVRDVAKNDLNNNEKFALAKTLMKNELKIIGAEYKDRYINQLIEVAYEKYKADEDAAKDK